MDECPKGRIGLNDGKLMDVDEVSLIPRSDIIADTLIEFFAQLHNYSEFSTSKVLCKRLPCSRELADRLGAYFYPDSLDQNEDEGFVTLLGVLNGTLRAFNCETLIKVDGHVDGTPVSEIDISSQRFLILDSILDLQFKKKGR